MRVARLTIALALALCAPAALAQTQPPGDGGPDEPPAAGDTAGDTAGDDAAPSASTGDDAPDEGDEPAQPAPAPPVAPLSPEAQERIGVAPGEVGAYPDPDRLLHRTLVPPVFLRERGAERRNTVVFPFFYRERDGDATTYLIGPYYRHRSPRRTVDVAFPLWWHWRGTESNGERWGTDVIPPFYYHSWSGPQRARGTAVGVAPLFFYGESFGENGLLRREHLVIPPLLTYHTWRPDRAFTVAGPFYYDRTRADTDWGLAPLFFAGNDPSGNYLLIPPLLTYHRENRDEGRNLTVVGPFWTESTPTSTSFNLAPLFFHRHDRTTSRTTLFPLFHLDSGPDSRTVVTPLAVYTRRGSESTLLTWVYQNHRGATDWDAVAPFFYYGRDRRLGSHTEAFLPLFYHSASPTHNTWWVLPTVHSHSEGNDWFFNVYPLVYAGRSGASTHTVIAPLYFDFRNETERTRATMVTPLFWRFESPTSVTQLAGNVLWISTVRQGVRSYEWHVLPLFSYARPRPEDLSWNVLFGLVGYRRQGSHSQLKLFWVPISLD